MNSEVVTIPKTKLEELENRVDAMQQVARECLQKIERLIKIARGESPGSLEHSSTVAHSTLDRMKVNE